MHTKLPKQVSYSSTNCKLVITHTGKEKNIFGGGELAFINLLSNPF